MGEIEDYYEVSNFEIRWMVLLLAKIRTQEHK